METCRSIAEIRNSHAYLPLLDVPISQRRFIEAQFRHGCISSTLQRIRRVLQDIHAFFARFLIGELDAFGGILEKLEYRGDRRG